jgi:putative ABC transport system permease protein
VNGSSALRTTSVVGGALRGRLARSALTVAGIGSTTLLVLVLLAAQRSLSLGVRSYVGRPAIDLWVAPVGTDNLIRSSGFLPAGAEEEVRAIPGVAAADPLLRSFAKVEAEPASAPNTGLTLLSVGYRVPGGLGGPPILAAGRDPTGSEVVLDRAAAYRLGVAIGDTVRVNGIPGAVVGLSRGTNLLATQFLFGDIEAARAAHGLPGRASFLAVGLAPGADADAVARRIRERLPGAEVFDRPAFVQNNLREVTSGVRPLLVLVAGLGLAVAIVLVVLMVESVVEDGREEIAVLLALGAGAPLLGLGLALRTAVQVVGGAATGGALALGLRWLLDRALPSVELTYASGDFLRVLTAFVVAGMAASLVPLLRLRRIDPLEAFRP